jgi:ribosomal protein S18 acetylase RimI-like enzyme
VVDVFSHDQRVIGTVTVVWEDLLVWGGQPEPAGYTHMLMLDPSFGGYEIGRSILECAEGTIRAAGRLIARLDPADNDVLRSYYEAVGYHFVEAKALPDIEGAGEAALYEKTLGHLNRAAQ